MEILKAAMAGTLESSDAQVMVEPADDGIELTLESSVMNQYGRQIKATVLETLEREIAPCGIAEWQKPKGGYFVSVNTMEGIATRTLALCKEAGVVMTAAGATFPYGKDPRDSNIRIAPSLPPVEELEQAMEIFCVSMKLAALEKLLG